MPLLRIACFILLAFPFAASAQVQPHVTLRLDIGLTSGMLGARACLSPLPPMRRYEFILHRGLNIKSVRDGNGDLLRHEGYADGRFIGEGVV